MLLRQCYCRSRASLKHCTNLRILRANAAYDRMDMDCPPEWLSDCWQSLLQERLRICANSRFLWRLLMGLSLSVSPCSAIQLSARQTHIHSITRQLGVKIIETDSKFRAFSPIMKRYAIQNHYCARASTWRKNVSESILRPPKVSELARLAFGSEMVRSFRNSFEVLSFLQPVLF